VFYGDGFGGFVDSGTGPAMMLDQVHGIDWPSDGPGELLARSKTDGAVRLSNIDQMMPDVEPLGLMAVEGLAVGKFNDGSSDDIVALLENCQPYYDFQGGFTGGSDGVGPSGSCSVAAGNFDGDS